MTASAFRVSPDGCHDLLTLARAAIRAAVNSLTLDRPPVTSELAHPAAVFVTLEKNHRLRGCIGTTEPTQPLADAVAELAVSAACRDPRFPPVRDLELDSLHIEISVLSPLERIDSADLIQPGVHGVSIRSGARRGLFLPQVWESLPEKDHFLGELCSQKAGLPRDAWKSRDVELYRFTVFSFEEKSGDAQRL